jgi:hypothetical protein
VLVRSSQVERTLHYKEIFAFRDDWFHLPQERRLVCFSAAANFVNDADETAVYAAIGSPELIRFRAEHGPSIAVLRELTSLAAHT